MALRFSMICVALNIFGFLLTFFLIIKSVFWCKLHSLTENKTIITMSILVMILFAITTLIIAIGYIMNLTIYSHSDKDSSNFTLYGAICWRCGQMLAYSLFVTRFKYSFKSTKYDASPIIYCWLYFGTILFILVYILYVVVSRILKIEQFTEFYGWIINAILSMILNLILSISILVVFTKRLWLLTYDLAITKTKTLSIRKVSLSCSMSLNSSAFAAKQQKNYAVLYDDENSKDMSKTETALNTRQLSIIDALSKILVLSLISIISFQISMIIEMICAVIFVKHAWYGYDIFWSYIAFDSIINSLVIFLSFDSFFRTYYFVCSPMDRCCTFCCEQWTKKKIKTWKTLNVQQWK
eukprot:532172_1